MSKVLVDTSVWIDFLKNTLPQQQTQILEQLIIEERIFLTIIVYYEVLVGARSKDEFHKLQRVFSGFEKYGITQDDHEKFVDFSFDLVRKGILGSYPDVSIAFLAHRHETPIYSLDHYFHRLDDKKIVSTLKI